VYVLYYRMTCTAQLKSDFAQIWCASIIVAYLGISEKNICLKNEKEMCFLKMPLAFVSMC
jgi:hypothetical protein